MTQLATQLKNSVSKFHRDEEGMETLQVVLIIALAAIAGVAVYQFGTRAVDWCKGRIDDLFGKSKEYATGSGSGSGE